MQDLDTLTLLKSTRIVAVALMIGVAAFAGVAFVMGSGVEEPDSALVTIVFVVMAGTFFLVSWVVPGVVARALISQAVKDGNCDEPEALAGQLCRTFQTLTIITLAMREGAAFMLLIAYIVEGHWLAMAVALVILASMVATFPTEARFKQWAKGQLEFISQRKP